MDYVNSCKTKSKLYNSFLKTRSLADEEKYKNFNRIHVQIVRLAKKRYIADNLKAASNSIKDTWKILNGLLGKKKLSDPTISLIHNNETISEPASVATAFNNYFVSISAELDKAIPQVPETVNDFCSPSCSNSFFFAPCTEPEINSIIKSISNSKSVGHDQICSEIVKQVAPQLTPALVEIINLSLTCGQFPDKLKIAKVISIYKSGSKTDVSNYRPISILPVVSKIFERVAFTRLYSFLEKNNILHNCQYGFRPGRSTEDATLRFVQDVSKAFENNHYTRAVFLDLKKAFDTVYHEQLLSKLSHCGIRGEANKWFQSYLANRKQYVEIKEALSDNKLITCGVPQGSILGPLLFLIYINELPAISNLLTILFADDTTLYLSGPNLQQLEKTVNAELQKISQWLSLNRLSLNIAKSNFMVLRVRQKPYIYSPSIIINSNNLKEVSHATFLGLNIDTHLNWNVHVNYIASKIAKSVGILHKLKVLLPSKCLLQLYYALIQPYLNYCTLAWMNLSKTNKLRLLRLQKNAVRSILHKPYPEHSIPLFTKVRILPFNNLISFRCGLYAFKNKDNLIKLNYKNHNYTTRNMLDCYQAFHRTDVGKFSLIGQIPVTWNAIPSNIKSERLSFLSFRKQYFAHCLCNISLLY